MSDLKHSLAELGLRENPFAPTADPRYFFATREHKSTLFRLWNHIDERQGVAVVLGSYGTGKTTLLRKLVANMAQEPKRYNLALLGSPLPSWTTFSLLKAIATQFGLTPSEESFDGYIQALNTYLLENRERITTLVIDDAQNLNKRGQLEILRLVQNLETAQHKLLNIVCFAQMEWVRVLDAAPNFKQRINVSCSLSPLEAATIDNLMLFRLRQAGWAGELSSLFSPGARKSMGEAAQGNPRVLVTLARNALSLAAQTGASTVNEEIAAYIIRTTQLPAADAREVITRPDVAETSIPAEAKVSQMSRLVASASSNQEVLATDGRPVIIPLTRRRARAFESKANKMLRGAQRTRRGA